MGRLPQKLLIAGCGYVGIETARLAVLEGLQVTGLRRSEASLPEGAQLLRADLASGEGLDRLPSDVDAVIYAVAAGAHDALEYEKAYVRGVRNLLAALERCGAPLQRFLFVSSTGVYAEEQGGWVDECSLLTEEKFNGKLVADGERLAATLGRRAVAVRFGGIYGPGRERFIREVQGKRVTIDPNVRSYTNRIHRDDCARVLLHLLKLPAPEAVYNGVDDEPADRNDVCTWLADRLGVSLESVPQCANPPILQGKRCRNLRLRESGFQLRYPTFREGFSALLA